METFKKKIQKEWAKHPFLHFGKHPSMKALCVCSDFFGEEDDRPGNEVVFAVPENWLLEVCKQEFSFVKTAGDMQYWLENSYTATEAYIIFRRAMEENQIVMLNFN